MSTLGTTFYINKKAFHPELVGPNTPYQTKIDWLEEHATRVGLRVNAGYYCFDCKQTLCSDGPTAIHAGRAAWFDHCPKCKVEAPPDVDFAAGPIHQAKSFFWYITLQELKKLVGKSKKSLILDSDGRDYNLDDFTSALKKIQFQFNSENELIAG